MSEQSPDWLDKVLAAAAQDSLSEGVNPAVLAMMADLTRAVITEAEAQSEMMRVLAGIPPLGREETLLHQIGAFAGMGATLKILAHRGYLGKVDGA